MLFSENLYGLIKHSSISKSWINHIVKNRTKYLGQAETTINSVGTSQFL